jgi:hypothetical protein
MATPVVPVDEFVEVQVNKLAQTVKAIRLEGSEVRPPPDVTDVEARNTTRRFSVFVHGTASTELRRQRGSGSGRITRDFLSQRRYRRSRRALRHIRKWSNKLIRLAFGRAVSLCASSEYPRISTR